MAFRTGFPTGNTDVLSVADSSTSGTVAKPFTIPQDADSISVRVYTGATFSGTSPTCNVYLQTTEDGGTTWRDVASFNQITTNISSQNAQWVTVSNLTAGTGSITTAAASSLGAGKVSGLGLLSPYARIYLVYGGTIGTNSAINVDVFCPTGRVA